MIDSISPYVLLKRSKPKSPSYVTEYDLYSMAQPPHNTEPFYAFPARTSTPTSVSTVTSSAQDGRPSASTQSRTHYISAIKQKHSHALRRVQMTPANLPSHSSFSSIQTPPT